MNNIFSNHGKIITGDLYIHRSKIENELTDRVFGENNFGSVSVIGLQRMGKSTLVYNTVTSRQDELYDQGVIVVSCSMNNYANPDQFFKGISETIYECIEDHEYEVNPRIQRRYNICQNESVSLNGAKSLQNLIKTIYKLGKRIVCVIDEFDHSRKLFCNFTEGFYILRELAYQPDTNVSFVFVSRRMVSELESASNVSTLGNILGKSICVTPYSADELSDYFKRNKKYGVNLTDKQKETVESITGSHPYWLDLLFYHCCQNEQILDYELSFSQNLSVMFLEFDNMLSLLAEQSLEDKLFQIIFGPAFNFTKSDVQKLRDYGIINFIENQYCVFSKKLYEYMKMKESTFDFYPLWNSTEKGLRRLIKKKLCSYYGNDWENTLIQNYGGVDRPAPLTIEKFINDAISLRNKMKHQKDLYTFKTSLSVVDSLTTAGLFKLYIIEYGKLNMSNLLGMDVELFEKISQILSRARNPYQHNNDDLIDPSYKTLVKGYCELLSKKIQVIENEYAPHS